MVKTGDGDHPDRAVRGQSASSGRRRHRARRLGRQEVGFIVKGEDACPLELGGHGVRMATRNSDALVKGRRSQLSSSTSAVRPARSASARGYTFDEFFGSGCRYDTVLLRKPLSGMSRNRSSVAGQWLAPAGMVASPAWNNPSAPLLALENLWVTIG